MKRVVFLLCLFSIDAHAQQLTFRQFTDGNGLPSSEVYQLVQDKNGFIWAATDAGVARYDGENMDIFNKTTGLPDPVVFGFHEFETQMWFRSFSGSLAFTSNDSIILYENNHKLVPYLLGSIVNSIYIDTVGNLWITTAVNGKLIQCRGGGCSAFDQPDHTLFIKEIEKEKYVSGYTGTANEIRNLKINDTSFPIQPIDTVNSYSNICTKQWKGKLFIAINRNIYVYHNQKLELFRESTRQIINLSTDNEGSLWVGYLNGGTEQFIGVDQEPVPFKPLTGKSVTTVLQDNEGGYWFSTLESGVFHFPSLVIGLHQYIYPAKVGATVNDRLFVYTGDYLGQVIRYSTTSTPRLIAKLPTAILDLVIQGEDLWISTVADTYVLKRKEHLARIDGAKSIKDFWDDGVSLWAVNRKSIFQFKNKALFKYKNLGFWPRSVTGLNHNLIVASTTGAYQSDSARLDFAPITRLEKFKIKGINTWNGWGLAATIGNGLVLWNPTELKVLDIAHGFPFSNVYQLHLVGNQALLGTEEGIISLDLASVTGELQPVYYTINQLHGLPYDKNNFIELTGSTCWSFYDEGFTFFSLPDILEKRRKPKVLLRGIKVNDLILTDLSKLTYKQNNLSFEIQLISFASRKAFFRHRLKTSQPWNYTKSKTIEYFNLAPGDYITEIEFSTDQQIWNPLFLKSFRISSPWWQSWSFRLSMVIVALILITLLIMNRIKDLRMKEISYRQFIAGVEQERIRVGGELHDNIGSQLSNLKLSDSNYNISELDKIIAEVRNLSHEMAPPFAHVDGLIPLLRNLISRTNDNCGIEINLQVFDYQECFNQPQVIQLYRIFQELLNNLSKHSNAQSADIQIFGYPNQVVITMEDDGVGFDIESNPQGFGLNQLKIRTGLLNGKIEITSNLGLGTHIMLEIPVHH
jgi:hypothetical protein